MNIVVLCGYLSDSWKTNLDIENEEKKLYARNTLAITKKWINEKGNKEEKTEWIPIVIFGKKVKTILDYTQRGSGFLINGEITTSDYISESGEKKRKWQVVINEFDLKPSLNKKADIETENAENKEYETKIIYENAENAENS